MHACASVHWQEAKGSAEILASHAYSYFVSWSLEVSEDLYVESFISSSIGKSVGISISISLLKCHPCLRTQAPQVQEQFIA